MSTPASHAPSPHAPSQVARRFATLSIIIAGLCGGLIGYSVTTLTCNGGTAEDRRVAESFVKLVNNVGLNASTYSQDAVCAAVSSVIGFVATLAMAAGTSVVSTLMLRASVEWRQSNARNASGTNGQLKSRVTSTHDSNRE